MSKPSREAGFTLPELLVAISILAIIVGALGQAMFVGLKTTTATADTLVGAGASHALESHVLTDVKGADAVGTTGGPPCAPATPPTPVPTRVFWTQSEGPATGTKAVAAYFVTRFPADAAEGTSARSELSRIGCSIDATGASLPGQAQVLARWPGVDSSPGISCDQQLRSGGQTTLESALGGTPGDTTVELHDVAGLPASMPYDLVVEGETMTVTAAAGANALTVTRSAPAAHAAGAIASWGAGALATQLAPGATSLTLTHIAGFPTTGPAYPIVIDGETMTVTGGFGTSTLALTRDAPAPAAHPAGSTVTFAICGAGGNFRGPPAETTLAEELGDATDTDVVLNDPGAFPAAGPDYPLVVDGETMIVTNGFGTNTLTVTRAPTGIAHDAGKPVSWGKTILQAAIDDQPTSTTVELNNAAGFPTTGPDYPIVVGGERMIVIAGFGTTMLTVTRAPSPAAHAGGSTVTWGQTLLDVPMTASSTSLTLSDTTGFPTAGPDYRLVVDGETMTVTGGFGTSVLTVTRTSGVVHEAGAPVSWTPALITLTAPTVDAEGGPAPFSLSVSRRAT